MPTEARGRILKISISMIRMILVLGALGLGLLAGFVATGLTFKNQFQQMETVKGFLVVSILMCGMYLLKTRTRTD